MYYHSVYRRKHTKDSQSSWIVYTEENNVKINTSYVPTIICFGEFSSKNESSTKFLYRKKYNNSLAPSMKYSMNYEDKRRRIGMIRREVRRTGVKTKRKKGLESAAEGVRNRRTNEIPDGN